MFSHYMQMPKNDIENDHQKKYNPESIALRIKNYSDPVFKGLLWERENTKRCVL